MELSNEVVLMPKFSMKLNEAPDKLLLAFEAAEKKTNEFVINRIDSHLFIRVPKKKTAFLLAKITPRNLSIRRPAKNY